LRTDKSAIRKELQDLAIKLAVNTVEIAVARQRSEIERAVKTVRDQEQARREQREKQGGGR